MTIRSQILSAIKTRLATIAVANGFNTNLGLTESYFNGGLPAEYDTDTLAWMVTQQSPERENNQFVHQFDLAIEGIKYGSTLDPQVLHDQVWADIYRAIGQDETWGVTTCSTEPGTVEFDVEVKGQKVIGVRVTMSITYETSLWAT